MRLNHVQYSSVNSHHRYTRPFINYHENLQDEASKLLRKRFPKFIHKISLPEDQKVIPNLNHIKILHTFKVSRSDSDDSRYRRRFRSMKDTSSLARRNAPIKKSSQLLKWLKPMKNQIKRLTLGKFSSLTRHFPNIQVFDLDFSNEDLWKSFLFCSRVESLNMSLISADPECNINGINSTIQFIRKYGLRFTQRMVECQSIKHLRVCLEVGRSGYCKDLVDCYMILFTKMTPLLASPFLKTFTFEEPNSLSMDPQNVIKYSKNILPFTTQLKVSDWFWSYLKPNSISFDSLESLSDLSLSFSEKDSDLSGLSSLSVLPSLKKINFSFKRCERSFFEYFTLPKTVEHVKLKLKGFSWDYFSDTNKEAYEALMAYFRKDPQCIEFFSRWSDFDHLKQLKVKTISDTNIPARFVMLLAERLSNLETFTFKQSHAQNCYDDYFYSCYSDEDLYNEEYNARQKLAEFNRGKVSIDSFLKKLQKSRLCLQKLHIQAESISCYNPQNITADMPQLKSFTVQSQNFVYGGQNLLKICNDLPITQPQNTLLLFNINKLFYEDNLSMIDFFNALIQVPETWELNLSARITRVSPDTLVKHLCRFLAKSKMRGSLCIMIEKFCLCSWENLEKIKTAALKNSSLRLFQIKSGRPSYRYEWENSTVLESRRGIITKSSDSSVKLA